MTLVIDLLCYTCLGIFGISCLTVAVCIIWYYVLMSKVLKRNSEGPNLPRPRWLYTSWGQGELFRFAEKVDKNLARKMRQQMLIAGMAVGTAVGCFLLANIIRDFGGN